MSKTAERPDPKLWRNVKTEITAREKGGEISSKQREATRDVLMQQARMLNIQGRSMMTKIELQKAIRLAKH